MCSIVLTFNENDPKILQKMAQAVRHRGPDSLEFWTSELHGVAGCRLSIFGDANAPMIYHDKRTRRVVLLNGEIYNYRSLWESLLKRGLHAETTLEAELIARLFEVHGTSFAALLEGMFAVAIMNESHLVLARDRFGIKPLYYTRAGDRVLVSSEIKGLLQHPAVTPVLDIDALTETRVFGYVTSQVRTFFQGILQVPPGSVLTLDLLGRCEEDRFGALPTAHYLNGEDERDYAAAVQETRSRVITAVDKMFRHGNMTKGVYLSGGVDSTAIAYVAKKELGYPIKTFTLGDGPNTPDMEAARQVARALGAEHHEFQVAVGDYWRSLPDYLAHYESLMAGGVFQIQGGLAFHLLSQKVAEHVRVAFSGEGADELFGGYYWIFTHPLGLSDRIRGNLAVVDSDARVRGIVEELFPQPEDERTYRRNLFDHLLRGGLSNYHLQSVDRSAGAFGFEIRPVYLDDDLSQWAMELPIDFKVPDKKSTKVILRDAFAADFKRLGIDFVISRPKMGMPSAVETLDRMVSEAVEKAISEEELWRHPLSAVLGCKMNLLLFDLFEHIFFGGWDHHSENPPPGSYLARLWPA